MRRCVVVNVFDLRWCRPVFLTAGILRKEPNNPPGCAERDEDDLLTFRESFLSATPIQKEPKEPWDKRDDVLDRAAVDDADVDEHRPLWADVADGALLLDHCDSELDPL